MLRIPAIALSLLLITGCASTPERSDRAEMELGIAQSTIALTLDLWHSAADTGNFDRYFDSMTDDSIFLGTDDTERWTKPQFMDYAREPFADGHGWTYTPGERYITVAHDGQTAWSDELLTHDRYGLLRGTSVLVKINNEWKIAQYNLTFLVPNAIAKEVVELISTHPDSSPDNSH